MLRARLPSSRSILLVLGLALAGLGCAPPVKDPCLGVTCSGQGTCTSRGTEAVCLCNLGYISKNAACEADPKQVDACLNNPCQGGRVCRSSAGQAVCECALGFIEIGDVCRRQTACTPNPCALPHQTVCTVTGGAAVCSCDPGYAALEIGCTATPVYDCARQHQGTAADDAFEPDECPSLAKALPAQETQSHSIGPAGDTDWLRIEAPAGHIVQVHVTQATLDLALEAYGYPSLLVLSSVHGQPSPVVSAMVPPQDTGLLVRVRARLPSGAGTYSVSARDVGIDDHGNTKETATPVLTGAAFSGSIQYQTDIDVAKVPVNAGQSLRLSYALTSSPLSVEVLQADGVTVSTTLSLTSPNHSYLSLATGFLYLRAKGDGTTVGDFSITIRDEGLDDHGDTVAEATPVTVTTSPITAKFNRSGDIDVLSFQATAAHFYRVTCSETRSGCRIVVQTSTGSSVASGSSSSTATVTFPAPSTTVLYVKFESYYGTSQATYTWNLEDLGADDHGDTVATATAITLGTPVAGQIQFTSDKDVFAFGATALTLYSINCSSTISSVCALVVRDPSGQPVASAYASSNAMLTIAAAVTGAYTVEVAGYSSTSTGAYGLTVAHVGSDDHGNTVATGTTVTAGSTTPGDIQYAGDVDVLKFAATASTAYEVTCTTSTSSLCTMRIRNSAGSLVASASSGTSTRAAFGAAIADVYSIELSAYSSSYTGSYSVTISPVVDDHGGTVATATTLVLGSATPGNIQFAGDLDVFKFNATAGTFYSLSCTTSSSYVCVVSVKNSQGSVITSSSNGGSVTLAIPTVPTTDTYSVEISGYYSSSVGTYSLTVTAVVDDHGDTVANATTITPGSTTPGNIQFAGDKDVLKFTATARTVYTAGCTTSAYRLCVMAVRDPSGTLLTSASYSSSNSLSFLANAAGVYSIEYAGYSSSSSYTGAYTATLSTGATDDHGDTAATATSITIGTSMAGNIQFSGDKDFFSFTPTLNSIYSIRCTTSASYLCGFTVRDANGTSVASAYYGSSTTASFVAAAAGVYTIETNSAYSTYTGSYSMLVTNLGADDHGGTAATGTTLTLGAAARAGEIQFLTDVDTFVFTAAANSVYRFTCTSSSYYLCRLSAKNPSGAVVASAYESTSSSVTFRAGAAGTYSVDVTGDGSSTGTYSVTVAVVPDDHGDTPGTATGVTLGVSRASNLEFSGDVDYFSMTLVAGTTYTASTTGISTYITVYDPSLGQVGSSGVNSRTFTASTAGTYYFKVIAYYSSSSTGAYSFVLVQ